jgi:Flp pilus assembly pilin Flp
VRVWGGRFGVSRKASALVLTSMWCELRRAVNELITSEDGQDLIEYALLTGAVGFAGAATWPLIVTGIGVTYQSWDVATQGLWEVPDPQ